MTTDSGGSNCTTTRVQKERERDGKRKEAGEREGYIVCIISIYICIYIYIDVCINERASPPCPSLLSLLSCFGEVYHPDKVVGGE